jgi:hypothetical protein
MQIKHPHRSATLCSSHDQASVDHVDQLSLTRASFSGSIDKLYEEPATFVATSRRNNVPASRARRWQQLCGAAGSRRQRNRKPVGNVVGRGRRASLSGPARVPECAGRNCENRLTGKVRDFIISATTYAAHEVAGNTNFVAKVPIADHTSIKAGQARYHIPAAICARWNR